MTAPRPSPLAVVTLSQPTAEENGEEHLEASPSRQANRRRVRVATPEQSPPTLAEIAPLLDFDDIFAPEPDPKLVVPHFGITPGPPIALIGQGYVGKTIIAMSMGIAVASGKDVFGVHRCMQGNWRHLDHEQGRRHTKSRIRRLVAGLGIDREELRGHLSVAVYPRLTLTSPNALDYYKQLFDGQDLVTIDALKGVTPGVDENSSEIRDYIDLLSRASEATGAACVLIHHGGKTPIGGNRPRKESARGSSAIFDACAAAFVLTGVKGDPVHVSHEKDRELGFTVADFGLKIEDVTIDGDPKGGLKVVHLEKEQLRSAEVGIDRLVSRVVDVVRARPDCSGRLVRAECKGARLTDVDAALEEAERRGLIQNCGHVKHAKWRLSGTT